MIKHPIGLGTFPFANVFTPVNRNDIKKILKSFFESGGNFIDSAPLYGFGEVETLLGDALQSFPKKKYSVITKCGYIWGEDKKPKFSGRYKDVISDCEKSLKKLRVEAIDIYMSHYPDPNTPFEETVGAMAELQKKGKIKSIGVSNVTLSQLKEYNYSNNIKYIQNRFSLLNQSFDKEFQDYCTNKGIMLIPYQVIERGLLTNKVIKRGLFTNKVIKKMNLRSDDLRNRKPEFEQQRVEVIAPWVYNEIKPLADQIGVPISSLAAWWAINQTNVGFCICGATSSQQVKENLSTLHKKIPTSILDKLNESYRKLEIHIKSTYSMNVRQFLGIV